MSDTIGPGSTSRPRNHQTRYFTLFDALFVLSILVGTLFAVAQGVRFFGWAGGLIGLMLGPVIGHLLFFLCTFVLAVFLTAIIGGKL